jgi:VanZ family protein
MNRPILNKSFAVITAILAAVILYGSLYPFDFHVPQNGPGPLQTLLAGWNHRPGRGDFLSNILLYVPLGFFAAWSLESRVNAVARLCLALLLGACLSICIETLQYYDAGRDPQATDIYSNTLGTVIGAGLTFLLNNSIAARFFGQRISHRVPLMLLGAWAGYKLYPFVPVIDLHKYWNALKPIVLYPTASWSGLFTHAASWIAAAFLTSRVTEGKYEAFWFAAFVAFVMIAKILIMDAGLSVEDVAGAAIALVWLLATKGREKGRLITALPVLALSVLATRLEPFVFTRSAGNFGWVPFSGFMHGSINVNVLSFLEKFFLYGSLIWLLQRCGLKLMKSTALVAIALLATSILEIYIPARSAEITDAMMAVIIGLSFALVGESRQDA